MGEPFKEQVGAAAVERIAAALEAVDPAFPAVQLRDEALAGLAALELKDRVRHVAAALRRALPEDWSAAVARLVAARPAEGGLWAWPLLQVIEDHGVGLPEVSLAGLHALTGAFSAEFAIRPLLVHHPEITWATLARWASDPDPHVRRLVSEGSRPRLPWGPRLEASVRDPSRGLVLLDRLVDDPSPYVRRSVANHLGDVAKDHPDLAVATARRWLAEAPDRVDVVRHGLRGPLKAGRPDALALFGQGGAEVRVEGVAVRPAACVVGASVEITATVRPAQAATVRVDVVWSWPGARGGWSTKVLRGSDRALAADEAWTFRYRLSTRPVTTRPTRPGVHRLALRVLGRDTEPVVFTLLPAPSG